MAQERLKRLFGPATLTESASTKYTVPSGCYTIIHAIYLTPVSGNTEVHISIGSDASGTRIFDDQSVSGSGGIQRFEGPFVMEAGEILQAFQDQAEQLVNLTIIGEEFRS